MQIIKEDRKKGMLRIYVNSDDDLWHLYNILAPSDRLRALTQRTEECQRDMIRDRKSEKKTMKLTIEVEKCEFSDFAARLRVLGTITAGPQDHGCYHTINVEKGDRIDIFKEWSEEEREMMLEAVRESRRPTVMFLSIEDDNAAIAVLRRYGLEVLAEINATVSGKFYKQKDRGKRPFYEEVAKKVRQSIPEDTPLIVVGPGFAKDEFVRLASEKDPDLFKNAYLKATGQAGVTGIYEAMKGGVRQLYAEDARVQVETREVETFLEEIAKDGAVTYGRDHVMRALRMGAVKKLLLTDRMFREGEGRKMMEMTKRTGGASKVISTAHEAGDRLQAMGGVGALLRFKVGEPGK